MTNFKWKLEENWRKKEAGGLERREKKNKKERKENDEKRKEESKDEKNYSSETKEKEWVYGRYFGQLVTCFKFFFCKYKYIIYIILNSVI